MNIKDLTHRLEIEEAWLTTDGGGGFTTDWQSIATDSTVYAAIRQTGGAETAAAGKAQFDASYTITLRYRADMRPDYRLREGDTVYTITGIDDGDPAGMWLTLRATRSFFNN
jgi:SPP1 family predicted phage head-tail adaptor